MVSGVQQTPPYFGIQTTTGSGFNGSHYVDRGGESASSIYASAPAAWWAARGVYHPHDRERWIREGVIQPPAEGPPTK
jgi:hypothetical protein